LMVGPHFNLPRMCFRWNHCAIHLGWCICAKTPYIGMTSYCLLYICRKCWGCWIT
jgi:hypothetical protein